MDDLSRPGIYIHVPFCSGKCDYCDFYSITDASFARRYAEAVGAEIGACPDGFSGAGSLYLGGGSPSVIDARLIEGIVASAHRRFDLAGGAEVTIEVNPEDVSAGKLAAYRRAGVNRISIGMQSLDDGELRYLGRRHGAAQAKAAVEAASEAGFDNIAIDLIFGFAGHRIDSWLSTLERALDVGPDHISCYQLNVKDTTPLGERMRGGEVVEQDEGVQRELFLAGSGYLTDNGYLHYEVSSFARGEGRISRHNSKYWRHVPYIGLGPSAHSFDGSKRWWNLSSVESYCDRLEIGEPPVAGSELLSPDQLRMERLMLGLRTSKGVELSLIGEFKRGLETLEDLTVKSLVTIEGGRAVPTTEGYLMADRLPLLLIRD